MAQRHARGLSGHLVGASASRAYTDPGGYAPRVVHAFTCQHDGHVTTVPFAHDIDVPTGWPCAVCSRPAGRADASDSNSGEPSHRFVGDRGATQVVKSERDYFWERRSVAEAEAALQEALHDFRTQTGVYDPDALEPATRKKK